MKRILVIHTGGTISMSEDKDTGKVETNTEHPMHRHQAFIQSLGDITEINPFQVPSPHMNNQYINQLKDIITESIDKDEYDAFVITHGTDTLEETAYLLDLTIDTKLPIILTGAMRSSNEIGSDGLYNYVSALKVASTDDAQNKGVMVVFNDEIHTAKNVTKTHTSNTSTFQSPNYGPIGSVTKTHVIFHHQPFPYKKYPNINPNIKIGIVKAHMDLSSDLLDFFVEKQYDGLIIEALGQGNMPPTALQGIQNLLDADIPVVMVSRSFNGIVGGIYAYEGGGYQLQQMGIILSNGLNGQKARLKLLVGLSNHLSKEDLVEYFA
ncbi:MULTISPECIES: asparaginase [Mammaliicoccus]|uniref:asparaginase n=1 Tax=Mammaliicoccus sciuri TaxID=1296 RepID=A0ABT7HV13_MAMSC|nr:MULTISPECIES: asparaginase [Mammaliicoccus]MBF9296581.1 asparaginase [Staphylococcus schleiferi]MCJ0913943.1 asparaginase [Mammaliicoccus sciuri]MCJ1748174.1 asparaginase [Mammaliicoccus sciuri]MCJ1784127.1 asparaginase [Mammaliicoccus sciuri]MDL0111392.1 asparaginase [Mammaliicoccus sciuri]